MQKLAGHASITTTLRHYTRILPAAEARATRGLSYASLDVITAE